MDVVGTVTERFDFASGIGILKFRDLLEAPERLLKPIGSRMSNRYETRCTSHFRFCFLMLSHIAVGIPCRQKSDLIPWLRGGNQLVSQVFEFELRIGMISKSHQVLECSQGFRRAIEICI